MRDIGFTIARILALPVALLVLSNWLSLPRQLSLQNAREALAMADHSPSRTGRAMEIAALGVGSFRVMCYDAPGICESGVVGRGLEFRVWVQHTGLLGGAWVVAAERSGIRMAEPDGQNALYRSYKVVWGIGAVAALIVAFVLLYFGPFHKPAAR